MENNKFELWDEPKSFVSPKNGNTYETYSGKCMIDGKEYWMNAFKNTTKSGKKVFNGTFKAVEMKGEGRAIPTIQSDDIDIKQVPF